MAAKKLLIKSGVHVFAMLIIYELKKIFSTKYITIDVYKRQADGLSDYHIDFACHAVVDHSVELFALLCISAGDAVIGLSLIHI